MHSNVDRYYAYWQELQRLRGLSSLTSQTEPAGSTGSLVRDFQMPPFTSQTTNPFSLTRQSPTQAYGLNYEQNYCYRYDSLIFDGLTPEQFLQSNQCDNRQLVSIVPRVTNKFTRNDLLIINKNKNDEVTTLENAFYTMEKPWPYDDSRRAALLIDVTKYTQNFNYSMLDFDVVSYDVNGTRIENIDEPIKYSSSSTIY